MAQSGYTPILIYASGTATNIPAAGDLTSGSSGAELAINYADGKLYYKDSSGNVQLIASKAGASGDVVGPSSATDNAIVRFDGTTGKLVQNSVVTIADSTGDISGVGTLNATTLDATNIEVTNIKAKDGTAAASIADSTGVISVTANPVLSGGTANGVLYLNGSKVATSGSALTFDGTTLVSGSSGTTTKLILQGGAQTSMAIKSSTGTSGFLIGRGYASDDANSFFLYDLATSQNRFYIDTTPNIFQYATAHVWNNAANSTEYMRLTSTGLGIGTSSPTNKLTVYAGADGDVGFFRGGSTRQVQIGTSSTAGYINTDNGSAGLEIRTQGTARMYVDNSGNLGLGVTPSAWFSSGKAMQVGAGASLLGTTTASQMILGANYYFDGTDNRYLASQSASYYQQLSGVHTWYTAPSGTAGNAITFTQAMTLDASSNLGIGMSSPAARLVSAGSSATNFKALILRNGDGTTGSSVSIDFEASTGTSGDEAAMAGRIAGVRTGSGTSGALTFSTTNAGVLAERARITSGGVFVIGNGGNNGLEIVPGAVSGTPSRRGIKLPDDPDGYFDFYVNSNQNNPTFRWKNGSGGANAMTLNGISGDLAVVGALSKGSGSFKIDHPLKPITHHLVHSFIEGPQADLIYRGKIELVEGRAKINIDSVAGMTEGTFVALCREVQCFTSNESDWDAVKGSVNGNILTIQSQNINSSAIVSWMVIGERQDQHMYDTEWTDQNGKVIVEPEKNNDIKPSSHP